MKPVAPTCKVRIVLFGFFRQLQIIWGKLTINGPYFGKKCLFFIGSVATAVLVLSGLVCSSPPKDTIEIAWIGPLSGPVKLLGQDTLRAIRMAVAEYNKERPDGRFRVSFTNYDDRYDFEESFRIYSRLMNEGRKLDVVFVGSYTATLRLADTAFKDNVILINPIDNDRKLGRLPDNAFFIAKQTERMAAVVAADMIKSKLKKIQIIHFNGDDFMPTLADATKEIFDLSGGNALKFDYGANDADFSSLVKQAKKQNVDAMVFYGYSEMGIAMMQARGAGLTVPFFSVNAIANKTLQNKIKGAAEGIRFAHFTHRDGNTKLARDFLKRFAERYQAKPGIEWTALQGYDAANILLAAVGKLIPGGGGRKERQRKLQKLLFATRNYEGLSGNISIRADGTAKGIEWEIYELKNGVEKPIN